MRRPWGLVGVGGLLLGNGVLVLAACLIFDCYWSANGVSPLRTRWRIICENFTKLILWCIVDPEPTQFSRQSC